ncbi:hypothetical protein [Roseivirga thermotolerans]|uniref:Uncharacterized protein n=1 Tax=Roseivirga thermotolerans TaxID=1758176 RepID=A0ABQ3I0J0_9BACT|nr:hypothetical protein [Roseivirga thermotolerans]GHE50816.1 hypothetical protein GCM10011340_01010 [Roseivirga thermotolerans]
MKAIISKELFKKEPKKIIRTVGLSYAGIGAWCFFGLTLMNSTMNNFPEEEEFDGFNRTSEILQNIWTTYMPLLIMIGLSMVAFSFALERLKEQRIAIQTGILMACTIWVIAYSIASIPYLESFRSISPEQEGVFNGLTYIFAIFGFGAVFTLMTIPNYKVLQKLKAENTAM